MAHLISPINIDSTLYCVDEQSNMRTEILFAGDAYDNGGNTQVLAFTGGTEAGSMKFGTSCADEVTILLTSDGIPADTTWDVIVNGVSYDSGATTGTQLDEAIVVTLTPSPCGNIIEVTATVSYIGAATVASAILF